VLQRRGKIYVISRNIALRRRKTIAKPALMFGKKIWTTNQKDTISFSKIFWGLQEEIIYFQNGRNGSDGQYGCSGENEIRDNITAGTVISADTCSASV